MLDTNIVAMPGSTEERSVVIDDQNSTKGYIRASNRVPYALINAEMDGNTSDFLNELLEIQKYYHIYRKGAEFSVEGTNGDYIPATLKYKMAATLIDKEARFLFAESPDIVVESKGDVGQVSTEAETALTVLNDIVKTILDINNFEEQLIKAAKDCFIGKRVAGLVNFNEEDGVTITFLPSTNFLYETRRGNDNIIEKFVCFIVTKPNRVLGDRRIFKKKFELIDNIVYVEEIEYDGTGKEIQVVTEYQETLMSVIPAVIFVNDGLTSDTNGESEIKKLHNYESWYSKLANADLDSERKNMNPIKYTVNMESNSTKNLSTGVGAYWDLQTDQNLDANTTLIGMLESNMGYSEALKTSLDRIKTSGYEELDMPNISLETMSGSITSGKALKAIYWPLIVRCKEKMKMWGPCLRKLIDIIIQGSYVYPDTIVQYTDDVIQPVAYEIKVVQNHPLPEDELEEKSSDLAEVNYKTMSRKAYMQKWRKLTDDEVEKELQQIAAERQILEDSTFESTGGTNPLGADGF